MLKRWGHVAIGPDGGDDCTEFDVGVGFQKEARKISGLTQIEKCSNRGSTYPVVEMSGARL
jgi:hypothetical protein